MNAEQLLAHYERIAEAPDAIARLRRFVLDLAVRGKLVGQEASDEPTSQLIEAIATQKANFGRPAHVEALPTAEEPFPCRASWLWSTVGEICTKTGSGSTPRGGKDAYQTNGIPFLRSQNVHDDGLLLDDVAYIAPETHTRMAGTAVRPSDLLLNITGGSMGRCCRVEADFHEANVSQHVAIIRPALGDMSAFLHMVVLSPYFQGFVFGEQTGAGRGGLPKNKMDRIPVPLPPLAEQHRIVAKVDELMALCDWLEEARKEREAARDRLTAASLARLNAPDPDPATFTTHARFALDNLPALTTRADQIKQLRQTILRLGLAGKLTEQVASEESAAKLLERISQQRAKHLVAGYPNAKEAGTQQRKQAEQVLPSALPAIPLGWEWATLQQCALLVIDCKNKTAPYSTAGIRLIRTTNVRDGKINSIDQKYITPETYEAWSLRAKPIPGDILITREAPMGEVCIIPANEVICLGQRMMLARLVPDTIDPAFMLYSLRDPDLMERVQDKPIGMTVQHLRVGGVETLLVALPPLTEQRRIVAKLDELMTLCDRLETCLMTGGKTRQSLLEAILHEALEPAEVRQLELA
jgi:type I restriction enzyme S subunit